MNAVVTLTLGDKYEKLARLTHPTMRRHAAKIGAEFRVIQTRKFGEHVHAMYEKLQVGDLLGEYERILYVDTDAVINDHCPNLFKLVPEGWFGAFTEGRYMDRKVFCDVGASRFKVPELETWGQNYFNAGVMVVDRNHTAIFDRPERFLNLLGDQTWLNAQVARHLWKGGLLDIGPFFNRMPSMDFIDERECFIAHYAGGEMGRSLLRKRFTSPTPIPLPLESSPS